jgi:glycosyltransferase involved in cell wall biosynthesis
MPELSVVLPVFEEAENLGELIPRLDAALRDLGRSYEIVAVDDGSADQTSAVLEGLKARLGERLRVVRHLVNRGNGAALRSGARVARGEVVVFMDADGQHDPRWIKRLVEGIPPFDLVIGARTRGYRGSLHRNLANRFYNHLASWLSGQEVKDLTSGFRAMRRKALLHFLPLLPDGFSAPTTITLAFLKAGYNVAFVPVEVGERRGGRSKIRLWRDGSAFLLIILRMIVLYDPLRIFLPVAVSMTILGTVAWVAGMLRAARLVLPNAAIFLYSGALFIGLLSLVSSQIASLRVFYHGDETILVDGEPVQGEERGDR